MERFYGFYRPFELELQATLRLIARRLDLTERLKTPLLSADLRALGLESPELDAAVAAAKDTFPKLHRRTVAQGDSP